LKKKQSLNERKKRDRITRLLDELERLTGEGLRDILTSIKYLIMAKQTFFYPNNYDDFPIPDRTDSTVLLR